MSYVPSITSVLNTSVMNILRPTDNANEILPNLWLGNYHAALDIDFLKRSGINMIINCTKSCPFFYEISVCDYKIKDLETYRIPVNDSLLEADFIRMEKYLRVVIPLLLRKYTVEKRHILIHCHAGKQRSAIVMAALLKVLLDNRYITLPTTTSDNDSQFTKIYNYLLTKRHNVFTYGFRINFISSYKRFFNMS